MAFAGYQATSVWGDDSLMVSWQTLLLRWIAESAIADFIL
jgi:hypothetical protein